MVGGFSKKNARKTTQVPDRFPTSGYTFLAHSCQGELSSEDVKTGSFVLSEGIPNGYESGPPWCRSFMNFGITPTTSNGDVKRHA